jgi:hypothetical protein
MGQFNACQSVFSYTDEKKQSVRYDADDPINGVTNAIYIRKKFFQNGHYPAKIRVSITEAE